MKYYRVFTDILRMDLLHLDLGISPFLSIIRVMRKRILILTSALLLFFLGISSIFGEQKQISLGFEDGWQHISRFAGTRLQTGQHGFLDITLEPVQYAPSVPGTDLLIHFETSQHLDTAGNYSLKRNAGFSIVPDGRVGFTAGKFSAFRGGITLEPGFEPAVGEAAAAHTAETANSGQAPLFTPGNLGDSFTIEFWLAPQYLEDGETILQWSGQKEHENKLQLQSLSCTVRERRLEWNMQNFFLRPDHQGTHFTLSGRDSMVPEKWHHHMLRYSADSGVLEYLVDGVPADIEYCTQDGNPSGTVLRPYIGERSKSEIEIAPHYTGLIDELRISRRFVEEPMLNGLASTGGYAVAGPLDLEEAQTSVLSIDVEHSEPNDSKSFFYYRIDDQTEWIPFQPGVVFETPPTGRYLELKFQLYPDGNGVFSPAVSSAEVLYRPNLPPPPPTGLTATPRNGRIEVSWNPIQQTDLAGYIVYYGTSSGVYRAADSDAGASPIDVGTETSINLSGLQNGTLYYIAVAAYDTAGNRHRSTLSREVSARPSDFYGE